jgi:C-terminal processing protease CtpA/Prc
VSHPSGRVIVKSLIPGMPAADDGTIQPGDIIDRVDNVDVSKYKDVDSLKELVMGPAGTLVTLTFIRRGTSYNVGLHRFVEKARRTEYQVVDSADSAELKTRRAEVVRFQKELENMRKEYQIRVGQLQKDQQEVIAFSLK